MKKKILTTLVSLLAILIICYSLYAILIFYPKLSYSKKTQFGKVTVYHNHELEKRTGEIIADAIAIVKSSEIYDKNKNIKLCFNDDKIYPNLIPIYDTPAYASIYAVVLKKGDYNFNENLLVMYWEKRKVYQNMDLTYVLAHEFTHAMQYNANLDYVKNTTIRQINWKLEGHADYISKGFKDDGRLKDKIDNYLAKSPEVEDFVRVTKDENGKKYLLSWYKSSLLIQYLMEVKNMDYFEICELETDIDEIFSEMIEWRYK